MARKRRCPNCRKVDAVPILYGMPTPDAWDAAQRGEIHAAGCVVGGDDPEWHCNACGHQFGGPSQRSASTPSERDEILYAEDVPSPDASWGEIAEFAFGFDGYEVLGSFSSCAELGNGTSSRFDESGRLPDGLSLVELRVCLFFEQRRYHHFGTPPGEKALRYISALVAGIRASAPTRAADRGRRS